SGEDPAPSSRVALHLYRARPFVCRGEKRYLVERLRTKVVITGISAESNVNPLHAIVDTGANYSIFPQHEWEGRFEQVIDWVLDDQLAPAGNSGSLAELAQMLSTVIVGGKRHSYRWGFLDIAFTDGQTTTPPATILAKFLLDGGTETLIGLAGGAFARHDLQFSYRSPKAWLQ
ncbi:MAG: hypothetical protein KY475_05980, partial [Planctomycetes bacterium]|nr:hypothetical protein [Planctomycetota bacterium]